MKAAYRLAMVLLAANLLANPPFEQGGESRRAGWASHMWGGRADFAWNPEAAHSGAASRRIARAEGAEGGGTWRTRTAFRGFRVTSPDGRVLLDGLPDMGDKMAMAQYWEPYQDGGRVEGSLDAEDPFNSRVSQRMDLDAPEGWAGGPCARTDT